MTGSGRFARIFAGTEKPIIAMAHLPALPGTPLYDADAGMDGLVAAVKRDLDILLAHEEIDAVLFCNEGDRPYALQAGFESVAAMTRVVTALAPRDRPFGVDFLWDARAALAVAVATGADFIREVVTGVYESDMGLWSTDDAALLRERRRLDADRIAIFMNITPEFASPVGQRALAQRARSMAVSSLPDAVLVSGPMAGSEPDLETVRTVKEAVGGLAPVLVNTGVKQSNIVSFLRVADGAIIGSAFKQDGYTWNPVDAERVRQLVAEKKNGLAGEWPE